ncbi:LOW QUALITY PROTEIN: raftlin [Dasypus novemcinctus]|uniref:LOW QUALITY PROTEIN: raftlin n=1 Tax=Dasypus novemcinctus TaxID=9361 RepID=UPI0039C9C061
MGCGLNKLEKHDEKRPGNIYSTLKRPQVETKTDVAYEYRFLEFTTLSAAELPRSSAVRLASLRDLPSQLLELYQQGFFLAALHPFVQLTPERERTPLEHIFRAILIKKVERSQKTDPHNEGCTLELDSCSSLGHLSDQKAIPEFIKKVQEAAGRGLQFVGFVPQYPSPARAHRRQPPDARHPQDATPVPDGEGPAPDAQDADGSPAQQPGPPGSPQEPRPEPPSGMPAAVEVFALFNRPRSPPECGRYYPVTIPLRVSRNGQCVSGLDANWLEHTSDHFRKGGVLANAVLQLGTANDASHGGTDGVFIFEAVSPEDSKTVQGYDAIVVEQWTVLEGAEVRTDYVPLLASLAAYGWRLACVLATPVLRTTREGHVSTKQIVFLQRPCLPQRARSKEAKFQWRLSRDNTHVRRSWRPGARRGPRGRRPAEDGTTQDGPSRAGDAGHSAPGRPHGDGPPGEQGVPNHTGEDGAASPGEDGAPCRGTPARGD